MTLRWAARVLDTSTTTGTGPFTVSGTAPTGFMTFSAIPSITTSDTFYGCISDQSGPLWVEGLCTYSAANQVTMTTPTLNNSGGTTTPTFTSGSLYIWLDLTASRIAATIFTDASSNLTVGYTATSYSLGTISSGTTTLSAANGNIQHYTNNGAHTLAPQSSPSTIALEITNGTSASAITTTGYTKVIGSFATTNGNYYQCISCVTNAKSALYITQVV